MKVLIIEDEELAAKRLAQLLLELEPDMEIHGTIDSVKETVKHLQTGAVYDLLLLDIQLADGKSFSIFDHLKIDTPIIFTTAYDEYAIKAFELNSIEYLLKPINKEKLKAGLDKLRKIKDFYSLGPFQEQLKSLFKNLHPNQAMYKTRFLVNKGDTLLPVNTSEIAYFYAEDKVLFLVTFENKRFLINHTLEELEHKLNPQHFFRVNRQFIVSVSSIQKVHNYFNYKLKLELKPDPQMEIIISKAKNTDFKNWMNGER
jgi:two-component system LytT family response regulator